MSANREFLKFVGALVGIGFVVFAIHSVTSLYSAVTANTQTVWANCMDETNGCGDRPKTVECPKDKVIQKYGSNPFCSVTP